MNTQPTNEFLNHERLTDLAQFAVPDGHDLWPRIERAARASATLMAVPRPGFMSLGLSRAWTAVGILFIAATFAALGFGLAVLVLSNGHDQVPAAPVTPTPATVTATPIPPTQQAGANTPPLYVPDYPRDLDHIRETLGSVFVPTYVPDGYQLTEAEVNINELRRLVMWVEHEASLTYGNGFRRIEGTPIGEFLILQFPEGWDPTRLNPDFGEVSALNPEFEESTVDGLAIWQDPELESPGFHFQVDGRWLWISVFGSPNDTVGLNELVKVAKSVKRFGEGDPVDWLAVSGITRHGFRNTALSDLNEFVHGQSDEIHLSVYLPEDFGLESLWRSQDSDSNSITLEFVLPSHLKDGKRLERVTLSTSSHPTQYREQVDVGGTTGYVFRGTSSSDLTLVFQYDGRWYELVGHPATDLSVLDELIKMAESLQPYVPSHQRAPTSVNTGAPSSIPSRELAHAMFENSLSGDDLARFRTLPVEIQEALVDESLDSGNDSALRYLRDMPDDPPPLAEILDPESRALFDTIDEPYRRELLLKGYPNSTVRYERKRWLAGDLTDLEYKYGNFHVLVRGVIGTLSAKGHALPPLEETLSPAALTRFESLDPILQEAFRLDWETTRSHSVDDAADELEQDLLKAPLEIPGIRDLGLPSEAAAVLEREPALWLLAQRMVAGELVQGRNWDADDAAYLQRTIAAHEAPGGKEALERDLLPGGSGPWLPLLCNSSSQGGVPLDKAVLPSFRDLHPAQFVYAWPDPEDALSEKALANFNLLDETMLEAFEVRWYGHAVPVEARFMACLIAQWDRGLADILYTSMPGPDVLLPEDKLPFYDELTDHEKWAVNLNLAHDILMGEVIFKRDQSAFSATEHVSTFDSTPEEFLEGLRFAAVEWLCGFHPPACGAAAQVPTTSQTSTIPSRELAHAKLEAILTGETLDRYRALPPAYQEALGLYTWHALPHDLVRSAVKDKIDQWGDAVIPLPELLGEERAERFDGLIGEIVDHAQLLVSYYVLVLNTQSSDEARAEAMQQYVDYIAPPDTNIPSPSEPDQDTSGPAEAPMVAWPPLDKVLTDTALARLDLLGPRLRERVTDMHSISSTGESDIKNVASFLTHYELLLLKAQPHLEIPTLEETLTGDDLAAFRALSPTDRDRAESSFQGALFALHYTLAASHPTNLTIPKATPDFLAGQADFTMEFVTSARKEETASPTPDSWVSENGFIQFTTGDATFDEPLPGTHPWCFPPTRAPENPGPWLVPSELPKGMEQTVRNQLSTHSVLRAFQNSTDRVSMSQTLCATQRLSPVTYRAVPVGYRTAYVTAAVKPSADGVTPEFDPNVARSLVMDIGYGVVSFNVFGSVTVDELVSMAASLVPEELTDADTGPYPQIVLDGLGTSFGPIYVPGKLPDGYEMFGQLVPQPHGAVKATQLTYMRTRGNDCHFYLRQAAPGQIFPDVAAPAVVIDGVSLKTTHTPPLRPAEQYTTVHFKFEGVWFGVTINRSSTCDHSLEMVAEIAKSLEPLKF